MVQKKLANRSDRVKSVDLHPTEPWLVINPLFCSRCKCICVLHCDCCLLEFNWVCGFIRCIWITSGKDGMVMGGMGIGMKVLMMFGSVWEWGSLY